MRRSHVRIAGVALLGLLGFPGASHASFWDVIWSMSGPQMSGVVFHCEWDWEPKRADNVATTKTAANKDEPKVTATECRFVDYKVAGNARPRAVRRSWLTLDANAYTSTGKNSDGFDFKAFENYMIAFEPMVEIRSFPDDEDSDWRLHHGLVGMSYDILFGNDYGTFDKIGLKFRPIGFTYKKINGAFNVRWYPNGFTG